MENNNTWQLCPKCHGVGACLTFENDHPYHQCDVCKGKKIISIITGYPPVDNAVQEFKQPDNSDKNFVYGIAGLASILKCSTVTAQKLKSSGAVPYSQAGRKIVFDVNAVLEAIRGE